MFQNSDLTRDIDASIIRAKTNRRWEADYVIFQGKLYDEIRDVRKETRVIDVDNLIVKQGLTIEEACDILEFPVEDYLAYKSKPSCVDFVSE